MLPVMFSPGQQIKVFLIYRKKTRVSDTGRVSYSAEEVPIGEMKGTLSQASQKEQERWGQMGHPISHTIVIRGRTAAQAEDVIVLGQRRFFVQGKSDPAELGIFSVLYCEERSGVSAPARKGKFDV